MSLPSAIRVEYFDAALEKASNATEIELIRVLRRIAVSHDEAERASQKRSIAYRVAAGESPTRVLTTFSLC